MGQFDLVLPLVCTEMEQFLDVRELMGLFNLCSAGTVDNTSIMSTTLGKVDSANKHGSLLEVVQVLTDLNLTISRAYISSDGEWFMDVFYVVDQHGNKLSNGEVINRILNIVPYIIHCSYWESFESLLHNEFVQLPSSTIVMSVFFYFLSLLIILLSNLS